MSWFRTIGLTEERRPFRDKLWAWWIYAALGLLGLALTPFMLAGVGSDDPAAARLVGLVLMLPMSTVVLVYAVVAFQHQRR